jgi:phosphatidylserine/phosphatidylglycerophosphate/cardiolipin synthase-like enzyme
MKNILISLLAILSLSVNAADIEIGNKLQKRNYLFQLNRYLQPYLYDQSVVDRMYDWLSHPKNLSYSVECQFRLRPFFRAEKILAPLCYLIRQDDLKKRSEINFFVDRYLTEVELALTEITEDPRFSSAEKSKAQNTLKLYTSENRQSLQKCLDQTQKIDWSKLIDSEGNIKFSPFVPLNVCLSSLPKVKSSNGNVAYFALNIASEFSNHPGHTVSDTGWIEGNNVSVENTNDVRPEILETLEVKAKLMEQIYPLNGRGSLPAMMKADLKNIFTQTEGFDDISKSIIWNQESGIFKRIITEMDKAQKNIFIDIFFLGGSMGASMAKYLVKLVEKKGLKIFILRDQINHFGHEAEMLPVYNYLRAFALRHQSKNAEGLIISPSYIKGHKSGLPKRIESFINDDLIEVSGLQSHLSLYAKAKSDHSKVLVIDGDTTNPTAIVGSKNWTDTSGGFCFDEIIVVNGPGAAVVLDDYYYDMYYSLLMENTVSDLKTLSKNSWAGNAITKEEMIVGLLAPFDLLKRDANGDTTNTAPINFPRIGNQPIRTGQNDVLSLKTSAVDQVLQAIGFAKKKVLIKDQFLFDRNVVMALIDAKKKNPDLDVRVILEPLLIAPIKGMPNLLYLDLLKEVNVKIKFKVVAEHEFVAQEYHMKTLSVDGKEMLIGSANKDQTTMYGAFREHQVEVLNSESIKTHDDDFERTWNDPMMSSPEFVKFDFTVPSQFVGPDGKALTQKQFVGVLRDIISILFDNLHL